MRNKKKYLIPFLFGFLGGLSFPPLYLLIFLPFSFYYIIEKIVKLETKKEVFLNSLIFGFGYFLIQLYWISFSLFVDIKSFFWLVPFAISFIPLACALFFCVGTVLFFITIKKFQITNKFFISLIFSFFYALLEYFKGFIFPWNLFSYIFGFSDILIQVASIINIYLLNFIIFLYLFGFVY